MTLDPAGDVRERGAIVCVTLAHVHDMGRSTSPHHHWPIEKLEELQAAWKWGSQEVNEFVQTRMLITQLADGSSVQFFHRAAQKMTMIVH